jgi:hypothetical protein
MGGISRTIDRPFDAAGRRLVLSRNGAEAWLVLASGATLPQWHD